MNHINYININEEDKNENNNDISNMLSNIGIIVDKKEESNKDIKNNNKSIENKENCNFDLMGRYNKTILHQSKNHDRYNIGKIEIKTVDKNKK